jgi:hypothetical protein
MSRAIVLQCLIVLITVMTRHGYGRVIEQNWQSTMMILLASGHFVIPRQLSSVHGKRSASVQNDIFYLIGILIIVAIALVYNLYQLWVTPEEYATKLTQSVKDWWPFASFYRHWFASKGYIWLYRFVYSLFLLIVITILGLLVLGVMGMFP